MKRLLQLAATAALFVVLVGCSAAADGEADDEAIEAVPADWVEAALALDRDLETISSQAFTKRDDPQAVTEWTAWADEWSERQRRLQRQCQEASQSDTLSAQDKAACEAIGFMRDKLTAYRDLIAKPGNERQMDLRKENLEIARDLVNQALDRAIGD